jgi:hypothetical protein
VGGEGVIMESVMIGYREERGIWIGREVLSEKQRVVKIESALSRPEGWMERPVSY